MSSGITIPSAFVGLDANAYVDGMSGNAYVRRCIVRNNNYLQARGVQLLNEVWDSRSAAENAAYQTLPYAGWLFYGPYKVRKSPGHATGTCKIYMNGASGPIFKAMVSSSVEPFSPNSSRVINITGTGSSGWSDAITFSMDKDASEEILTVHIYVPLNSNSLDDGAITDQDPYRWIEDSTEAWTVNEHQYRLCEFRSSSNSMLATRIIERNDATKLYLKPTHVGTQAAMVLVPSAATNYYVRGGLAPKIGAITAWEANKTDALDGGGLWLADEHAYNRGRFTATPIRTAWANALRMMESRIGAAGHVFVTPREVAVGDSYTEVYRTVVWNPELVEKWQLFALVALRGSPPAQAIYLQAQADTTGGTDIATGSIASVAVGRSGSDSGSANGVHSALDEYGDVYLVGPSTVSISTSYDDSSVLLTWEMKTDDSTAGLYVGAVMAIPVSEVQNG